MDFTRHQTEARSRSRQLIGLFLVAVLLVVTVINAAGAAMWFVLTGADSLPDYFLLTNTFVVLLFVIGSSWLEWTHLERGGDAIAHQLGARSPNTYDLRHKRFINVAEEVAISASIPVPELFVLDHESINALAAGHDVSHAAIVVTDGALQMLTRDELQGVVAHEVAHIVNGDAAMNTRLTGALYGLYSLHILGRNMLSAAWASGRAGALAQRSSHTGGSSLGNFIPVPLLLLVGGLLMVVGWLGKVAGHLVQAGVSRQREFLADAHAIQLTRSNAGIGGALRKIAGQEPGTQIGNAYAEVVSHFWLSADQSGTRWFDSHPPLVDRVRRVYGRPLPPMRPQLVEVLGEGSSKMPALNPLPFPAAGQPGVMAFHSSRTDSAEPLARHDPLSGGQDAADNDQISLVDKTTEKSADSVAVVPEAAGQQGADDPMAVLFRAVRDPGSTLSQAALILNAIVAGPVSLADNSITPGNVDGAAGKDGHVNEADEPATTRSISNDLYHALLWLEQLQGQWLRVPLIETLASRLRQWPQESRHTLVRYCHDAVLADGRVEKTEWIYFTLVRHRLLPTLRGSARSVTALDQRKALAELFSMAASLSPCSAREVREAVFQAAQVLDIPQPASTPEQLQFRSLTRALEVLTCLPPLRKPGLLRSLEVLQGQQPNAVYQAFLAAVAAAIDCPPLQLERPAQNGADQPSDWQMVS